MRATTMHTGLMLLAGALGASACTSILGGFDFEGPAGSGGNGGSSSSSGGGGATSSSGGSGGATCAEPCTKDADCKGVVVCGELRCNQESCCAPVALGAGTPAVGQDVAGDCKAVLCDGTVGGTMAVADPNDVPLPENECNVGTCSGMQVIQSPISGPCSSGGGSVCGDLAGTAAGTCVECNEAADCNGGGCVQNTCAAPSCSDGLKNGTETDKDCGGATCVAMGALCPFARQCNVDADCATGSCNLGLGTCDAQILANNQPSGQAVAVDAGTVYWVNYGGMGIGAVMKLPLGTNTPIPLATNEMTPSGLTIDQAWPGTATMVYWTGGGMVKRKRADNTGSVDILASSQSVPGAGIVVDANAAYWANDGDSTVKKVPLVMPFTVTQLAAPAASSSFDQHMAYGAPDIYWSHAKTGTIYRTPTIGGGGAISVVGGQVGVNKPVGVAVDGVSVYWADAFKGTVSKMPVGGGSISTLASGLSNPWDIAIDTNNVYVLENVNTGRVLEISSTNGTMKVLVSGVSNPRGIAVDAGWVYYMAGDNTLRRVRK